MATGQIQDGAVTTAKINDSAVTTAKINKTAPLISAWLTFVRCRTLRPVQLRLSGVYYA